MKDPRDRIPVREYIPLALLLWPLLLALAAADMWFIPNRQILLPACAVLALNYTAMVVISRRNLRVKESSRRRKKSRQPKFRPVPAALLFVVLGFFCLPSVYFTLPAMVTAVVGKDVERVFTVVRFSYSQKPSCGYKLELKEISPFIGSRFCVGNSYVDGQFEKGSKIVLYGQESIFGLRYRRFGTKE